MTHSILPPELAASSVPWFSRARNYAIFSPEWFRYRSRALLAGCTLALGFIIVVLLASLTNKGHAVDWPALALLSACHLAGACMLVLLGPRLAVAVRRRQWPARRETAAIFAVLVFGMACTVAMWGTAAALYERPSFDSQRDVLVRRHWPSLDVSVAVRVPPVEYFSGLRRGPPLAVYHAAFKQYAEAFGVPAHFQQPWPEVFDADDRATMESIRQLDAGGVSMDASDKLALERRYAALVQKFRDFTLDAAIAARSGQRRPLTQAQAHAVRMLADTVSASMAAASPEPAESAALTLAAGVALGLAVLSLLCWLGGLFDLPAFVRQRGKLDDALTRQALARARDERNSAELKLSVLAAQVEPHFLFNTLASVRAAIASDPGRAAHIVDHMVDYLRATIPQMRGDAASTTVALGAQLAAARSYLALMHERIPRLQFTVDAEPGLERAAMPPLMLISLVENAVKHGVEPKIGPATVSVRARRNDDALEVSVTDDGVGFGDTSSGAGIGLSNIQERLRTLFGQKASLSLKTCPDGGVAAILRLPLSIEP